MYTDLTNANMHSMMTLYLPSWSSHKRGKLLNACTTTAISLWQYMYLVAVQAKVSLHTPVCRQLCHNLYIYIYIYQEGNHTPSTKPILPERVTLPLGTRSPIVRGDWGLFAQWPLREVLLTGMAPEVRNQNTVLVQFEA